MNGEESLHPDSEDCFCRMTCEPECPRSKCHGITIVEYMSGYPDIFNPCHDCNCWRVQ